MTYHWSGAPSSVWTAQLLPTWPVVVGRSSCFQSSSFSTSQAVQASRLLPLHSAALLTLYCGHFSCSFSRAGVGILDETVLKSSPSHSFSKFSRPHAPFFFETRFLYEALAMLERALYTVVLELRESRPRSSHFLLQIASSISRGGNMGTFSLKHKCVLLLYW